MRKSVPLKILYVLNQFPVLSQSFVINEVRELIKAGHHVHVIASRRGYISELSDDSITVLEDMIVKQALAAHVRLLLRSPVMYGRYLRSVLRGGLLSAAPWFVHLPLVLEGLPWKADHIHTHFASRASCLAQVLAKFWDTPRSVTTHASDIYGGNRHLRRQLSGARVATVTRYNQLLLEGLGYSDVALVRCGVDTSVPSTPYVPPSNGINIVSVGRLVPKKGHDVLIEACASLVAQGVPVRCRIIGDGPERESLQAQIRSLHLDGTVSLIGALDNEATLRAMDNSSVFVLACRIDSKGDADGLPVSILEAGARGLPLVVSSVKGMSELLTAENSWPVQQDNPTDLARQLQAVIDDPAKAVIKAGIARRQIDANFSLKCQVEAVTRLFEGGTT